MYSFRVARSFSSDVFFLRAEVPANILLEKFGEKFLDFCQDSGYDRILQVLGATPRDFLQVPNFVQMSQKTCINCVLLFSEFGRAARPFGHQ